MVFAGTSKRELASDWLTKQSVAKFGLRGCKLSESNSARSSSGKGIATRQLQYSPIMGVDEAMETRVNEQVPASAYAHRVSRWCRRFSPITTEQGASAASDHRQYHRTSFSKPHLTIHMAQSATLSRTISFRHLKRGVDNLPSHKAYA